jgi:AraC-like DNA-binding protein
MTIQFSFNVVLLFVGIVTGLLTALILLAEKANKAANKYLAALLLISVCTLLHNFFVETGIYSNYPFLYFLPVILSLGVGPLLYLYINRLTAAKEMQPSQMLLHLLPMIIQWLVYCFCFVQSISAKYRIYTEVYEPILNPLQTIANYLSVGIYGYLSWKILARFKTSLSAFYTDGNVLALGWLGRLLRGFMLHYALSVIAIMVAYLFKTDAPHLLSDITRCIIIFVIAFFAIRQNSLLNIQLDIQLVNEPEEKTLQQITAPTPETIPKTQASSKAINALLLQQIINLVEKEQLYLNEELTVADVAAKLGCSAKTISCTVNNGLQKSFSLFINEYRVNLFKERKLSGLYDQLSIMGLAYDCGFNSKSTFNRMYKEITGTAPKNLSR